MMTQQKRTQIRSEGIRRFTIIQVSQIRCISSPISLFPFLWQGREEVMTASHGVRAACRVPTLLGLAAGQQFRIINYELSTEKKAGLSTFVVIVHCELCIVH